MLRAVVDGGTGVNAKVGGLPDRGQDRDRPQAAVREAALPATWRRSPGSRPPTTRGSRPSSCSTSRSGGSYFAADVAAPVFRQIMQFALTYERIPPSEPVAP